MRSISHSTFFIGNLFRAFRYPTDFQLEMEYWSETGDLAEDELHEVWRKEFVFYQFPLRLIFITILVKISLFQLLM